MALPRDEAIPAIAPIGSDRTGLQNFMSMPFSTHGAFLSQKGAEREPKPEQSSEEQQAPAATAGGIGEPGARLAFQRHEVTGKMVARLVDAETGEVIRQVPAEEMLKLAEAIDRYLGLFVDQQS